MTKRNKKSRLIRCPREPENRYYREVCEEVFRKTGFRTWCQTCEVFSGQKAVRCKLKKKHKKNVAMAEPAAK
jgi:hypothetical protein